MTSRSRGSSSKNTYNDRTSLHSHSSSSIQKHTSDIFAMQEAGTSALHEEHAEYLISSILEDSNAMLKASSAAELARLMAKLKGSAMASSRYRIGFYKDIMKAIACVSVPDCVQLSSDLLEKHTGSSSRISSCMDKQKMVKYRSRSSRRSKLRDDKNGYRLESLDSNDEHTCNSSVSFSANNKKPQSPLDERTAMALSCIAYFMSLDDEDARSFLDYPLAVGAVAKMLRWDDVKSTSTRSNVEHCDDDPRLTTIKENDEDFSIGLEQQMISSPSREKKRMNVYQGDPTKRGRIKRRRIHNAIAAVSTGDENGSCGSFSLDPTSPALMSPASDEPLSQAVIAGDDGSISSASMSAASSSLMSTSGRRKQMSASKHMEHALNKLRKIELQRCQTEEFSKNEKNEVNLTSAAAVVPDKISIGWIALKVMVNIVNVNDRDVTDNIKQFEDQNEKRDIAERCNDKYDPLFLQTLLRETGSLPHLAMALRSCCSRVIGDSLDVTGDELDCIPERILILTSLIDSMCCLSSENRGILCMGTSLIEYLVHLVATSCFETSTETEYGKKLSVKGKSREISDEVILSCLKAVTSLSHENRSAGEQLTKTRGWCEMIFIDSKGATSCLDVIFRLLELTIKNSFENNSDLLDQKFIYDCRIFCLNILANATETCRSARSSLSKLEVSTKGVTEPAMKWLTKWLIQQTSPFHSMIVSGNIDCEQDNDFAAGDEESLVTAGNGFVFLACFMKGCGFEKDDLSMRKMILTELPEVKGDSKRVSFITRTLKAFLNFYHISVGALSVAVVSPVLTLIKELEELA